MKKAKRNNKRIPSRKVVKVVPPRPPRPPVEENIVEGWWEILMPILALFALGGILFKILQAAKVTL